LRGKERDVEAVRGCEGGLGKLISGKPAGRKQEAASNRTKGDKHVRKGGAGLRVWIVSNLEPCSG